MLVRCLTFSINWARLLVLVASLTRLKRYYLCTNCVLYVWMINQKYFINERKLKVWILIFRFLWRKNHFPKKICGQFKKTAKRRIIIIWVSWSFITNDSYLLWNIFTIIIICSNNTILLQLLCFQLSVDEDLISMIELKN